MQTRRSLTRHLPFLGAFILVFGAVGQAQEWMDVKDLKGRKLTMKVEKIDGDEVIFTTKTGKTFTYKITKFSVVDQLALRKWKPPAGSDSPVEEDAKLEEVKATDVGKIFQTKHYEFEVVGPVTETQLEAVTPHFEADHWAFKQLPSQFAPKPAGSHFKVKLFAKKSDFEISEQDQLPQGQPAVYNLSRDVLVAPIDTMESSAALTREVAYLLLGSRLEKLPPWLAVALTDYLAGAPFKKTYLDFEDPFANMLAHLGEAYGLANKNVPMLKPSQVLTMGYNQLRQTGLEGGKARSSALLTYYFFTFLDSKGKPMEGYLRALKTNTVPDEALAILANDRDETQLADALRVAYIPKKLRVAFIQ